MLSEKEKQEIGIKADDSSSSMGGKIFKAIDETEKVCASKHEQEIKALKEDIKIFEAEVLGWIKKCEDKDKEIADWKQVQEKTMLENLRMEKEIAELKARLDSWIENEVSYTRKQQRGRKCLRDYKAEVDYLKQQHSYELHLQAEEIFSEIERKVIYGNNDRYSQLQFSGLYFACGQSLG